MKKIENYNSLLNLLDTQIAIKYVKDTFQQELVSKLNLLRITAPLFVFKETGLNDDLNGVEKPVSFTIKSSSKNVEIVHSLAKWKRNALGKYNFKEESGIYTDMNAIRKDEDTDFMHSIYVDQWDWEKVISKENRTLDYLEKTVKKIYEAIYDLSIKVNDKYKNIKHDLPKDIYFISTSELERMYPSLSRKERENAICRKYKAVFLYQIGWNLSDFAPHDLRAADYDDWNLNGDILLYYDLYDIAFEISSMGIRVDENSLVEQLKFKNEENKLNNEYCKKIINKELPYSIGGGIGQSRLCMYMLKKAHIGEVQVSLWDENDINELAKENIYLL